MDSLDILGCRLDLVDATEATAYILTLARQGAAAQIVTLGTEMVVLAQKDQRFRNIVNRSALSLCDTVGLLTVARRRGANLRERVTGVELTEQLCARAAREDLPVYFIGGMEGVAADAAAILEVRFPGLRVAGTHDGYFNEEQSAQVVEEIRASGAKILFAGMGSPRQEVWLANHLRASGCGVGIGVGGSLDVLGGRVERAPRVFQRYGLEWLYRLAKEPHRWRRQLALPHFVWLVVLEGLGLRQRKNVVRT
ncbi:MAG: WecB/TagA/CpsF family glycosyltransferase [Candidatus Eremiobacteraeota bacterium]|nr:WecB/TagA/CpsF family glycosyltransferase [Candidatus Eremiobacteraeota bacterium]MBV8373761.1 WecB/TagA/CpsF family glycosyltransferase [Candidatus Eremiobacteraeota bacterium]